ncbi:MAG: hypothetical protein JWQ64_2065 [Subtercola sp.]|nr:hypothetical protein [Subtercola sp.]
MPREAASREDVARVGGARGSIARWGAVPVDAARGDVGHRLSVPTRLSSELGQTSAYTGAILLSSDRSALLRASVAPQPAAAAPAAAPPTGRHRRDDTVGTPPTGRHRRDGTDAVPPPPTRCHRRDGTDGTAPTRRHRRGATGWTPPAAGHRYTATAASAPGAVARLRLFTRVQHSGYHPHRRW